jgi:hypothetical protein
MAAEPPQPASSQDAQLAASSSTAAAAVAGVGGPNPCCAKVIDPPSSHHYAASCLVRFLTCLLSWGVFFWGLPVWVPQLWKKYQKLETSRTALREAVKLLQAENEKLHKENSELSKGS